MKSSTLTCAAAACAAAALISGCVVVPADPGYGGAYGAPAGAVYVAPSYAMPSVGYAWQYNTRYGWGWRHPSHGWHRGWR